ncbi:hypothetical protein M2138_000955 [Dysgonomonadaceae bacterium PH5-43]|nr:hypothetical protein [Dysgonomonadaceae bacterium PH5-43]
MYQKFTQKKKIDCSNVLKDGSCKGEVSPRKDTLAFIMQFARAYHVEKDLPVAVSGFVLN